MNISKNIKKFSAVLLLAILAIPGGAVAWDITTASYDNVSFFVGEIENSAQGLAFNTDGTKMFVIGTSGDDVNEYTLSSAFDVSTASFIDSFSIAAQETFPTGLAFNTDGTKMFVLGAAGDDVNEYTLSTGFDVSTASFVDSFSVSAQEAFPQGLAFSANGTKMFVVGSDGDDVNEYTLSTGFDVSTASFVDSFSVSAQETTPTDLAFNTDGTKMFVVGSDGDDVNEYSLSTGFDVSTASFVDSFSVSAQETTPTDLAFNTDGTKMFVLGAAGDDVNEYTLSTGFDVSTASAPNAPSFVDSFSVAGETTSPQGFVFNTDGTKMFVIGNDVNEYTLSSAFDASTASFVDAFNIAPWELTPHDVAFSADGTKMFVVGADGDDVSEFELGTGFDISTVSENVSFVDSFSVSGEEISPLGMAFNTDGTKMFVLGSASDAVNEYSLSTGFDVSTASFVDSFSVLSQESHGRGLAFNTDGTKMFVIGDIGDDVNEYSLSTGFDVSTASFVDSFSVATEDGTPQGLAFNTDGTKMFIVGSDGDDVNEYSLSTGFDVSTASFVDSFSVAAEQTSPTDLFFNTDGTKMFVIGTSFGEINEYSLSTGFDVSTASFVGVFSVSEWEAGASALAFSADGTKMFVVGSTGQDVNEFNLSIAFDVTIPTFSVAAQDTFPHGMAFNTDGTKMFVVGTNIADGVNEYTLSSAFDVTTASFVDRLSVGAQDSTPQGIAFNTDGTKMFVIGAGGDDVNEYSLSTGFDVSTASFVGNFGVAVQESQPTDIAFNTDGTKMFVVGADGDDVNEYSLSGAFDVTTESSFSLLGLETAPSGVAFNTDGTKMFVVGSTGDDVNEFDLSSAFDVSTASFVDAFSVAAQDTGPGDLAFNTDGTKMFIVGTTNDSVYEYALSTGFDVSTASFVDDFDPGLNLTGALVFNADGTKMMLGQSFFGDIHQYTLSTGFDVSTASADNIVYEDQDEFDFTGFAFDDDGFTIYVTGNDNNIVGEYVLGSAYDVSDVTPGNTFSVSSQDSSPQGLFFKPDGTKMFVIGSSNDSIYQYSVTPPVVAPTVSTAAATNVGNQSVTLNGSITATGGEANTVRGFSYGLTTSYGATTTESGSFSTGAFSAALDNLECDTTYHFRALATNSAGTGTGSDMTFLTSACASGGGGGGGGSNRRNPSVPEPSFAGDGAPDSPEDLQARISEILELVNNLRASLGLPPLPSSTDSSAPPAPGLQSNSEYTRDLTLGSNGNDASTLQNFLIQQNTGPAAQALAAVGATGYFGPLTQAALAEYQASVGIAPPAGYFGPITRAHLAGL